MVHPQFFDNFGPDFFLQHFKILANDCRQLSTDRGLLSCVSQRLLFDIEQIDVLVENLLQGQWNVGGRSEFFGCELGKIRILFDGIFDGL